MFDGLWEKAMAPLAGFGVWIYSVEKRLGNRVTPREFNGLKDDVKWVQSAVWDIMVAQKIKPSVQPPEEIKKLNNIKK